MSEATQQAIREWRELLNAGDYFAAHEVLESPWLRAAEPDKSFLKGLIHAAVALHHYRRGNAHGARVKYHSAVRYLAPYLPHYGGVNLADLIEQLDGFFVDLAALPAGAPVPPPRHPWPRLEAGP